MVVEIGEDADGVAGEGGVGRGEGVFAGLGDPEAAGRVEGHVHRLAQVGFRGDELDLEAGREVKGFLLLLRRERLGHAHPLGEELRHGGGVELHDEDEGQQAGQGVEQELHAMPALCRKPRAVGRKTLTGRSR